MKRLARGCVWAVLAAVLLIPSAGFGQRIGGPGLPRGFWTWEGVRKMPVLYTNLAGYWPLNSNGAGGVSLADAHSTGRNASLTNGVISSVAGKVAEGCSCDTTTPGGNSVLSFSTVNVASSHSWSAQMWGKAEGFFDGFGHVNSVNGSYYGECGVYGNGDGTVVAFIQIGDIYIEAAPVSGNVFHHYLFVADAESQQGRIYIDGALAISDTAATPWATPANGTRTTWNGSKDNVSSVIDECAVWTEAFDLTVAQWLYNSGSGRTYDDLADYGAGGGSTMPKRIKRGWRKQFRGKK